MSRQHPDPADPAPPPGFSRLDLTLSQGTARLVRGGSGPALVLVHGLGGCSADFFHCAPLLAGRFTCLMPDLPGYGASAKPDAPYDPDYFIRFLLELSQKLNLDNAFWAGHSMGGMLVLRLACLHPERVKRVAGICPAGGHDRVALLRKVLQGIFVNNEDELRFSSAYWLRLAVSSQFSDRRHPLVPALQARAVAQFLGPERKARERALIRSAAGLLAEPVYPLLKDLKRPAKLITGLRDWVVPAEETNRLAAHLPSNVTDFPDIFDCGHLVPFERPTSLAWLLTGFFGV